MSNNQSQVNAVGVGWFTSGSDVMGVVRVTTCTGDVKYYIGTCSGISQTADVEHIANWGAHFPSCAGDALALFNGVLTQNAN